MKYKPLTTAEALAAMQGKPGLLMLFVGHDATCPGAHGHPSRCNCSPTHELVSADELLKRTTPRTS